MVQVFKVPVMWNSEGPFLYVIVSFEGRAREEGEERGGGNDIVW